MILSEIRLENYKCFNSAVAIEVKPLTIIIGKNNSGKSALCRAALLISRALNIDAQGPVDLKFENLDFGSTFTDLIYNKYPHGNIKLGATFQGDDVTTHTFDVTIQHFDEYKLPIVSEFHSNALSKKLSFYWQGKDPIKDLNNYSTDIQGKNTLQVSFVGILPESIDEPIAKDGMENFNYLLTLRFALASAFRSISYLGPFRQIPQRTYLYPGNRPSGVGNSGATVAQLLGDDILRRKGELTEQVGSWFERNSGGWKLAVKTTEESFSVVLRKGENSPAEINLADVGAGVSQVLPIVTLRKLDEATGTNNRFEVVEQPELHLHPSAHFEVADLYVQAVIGTNARFIIETHSENFLLRLRRHVAAGKIQPEQIAIYWVYQAENSSEVRRIDVDGSGNLSYWPQGVFSEDFEEAKEIAKLNRK